MLLQNAMADRSVARSPISIAEAEGGAGEQPGPAAAAGGGVVPEPPRPDQAQADGGGLRVPQALVRAAGRGEPPPQVL